MKAFTIVAVLVLLAALIALGVQANKRINNAENRLTKGGL